MRRVTPAIPPSLYRHFAIVTLTLTTALAMFAEGETREAKDAHLEPEPVEQERPPVIAWRPASTSSAPAPPPLGWHDDAGFEDDFGQPMETPLGTSDDGTFSQATRDGAASPGESLRAQDAERELMRRGLRESIGVAPAPR